MSRLKRLLVEAHQRSLWQALLVYLGASYAVLEAVTLFRDEFGLPDWLLPVALVLLLIGLPVVVVTSLAKEEVYGDEVPEEHAAAAAEEDRRLRFLTWRNAVLGLVGVVVLLAASAGGYMGLRAAGIGPFGTLITKGVLEERDRIVLAEFENHTPDSLVALGATEWFRVALSQTTAVTLAGGDYLASVLGRMGKGPSVPLDYELAREVAVRQGLKAVIAGEVIAVGGSYVVSARLVAAETGEDLWTDSETAQESAEIIEAVDRLSRDVRERVGESLKTIRANEPLPQVSTTSLEALHQFSLGRQAHLRTDYERAIAFQEEAIALDSSFAMAYRGLAVAFGNLGQEEQARQMYTKAYELRERATLFERYNIEADYHWVVTEDMNAAFQAYEILVGASDSTWGTNNLGLVYLNHRPDYERAERLFRKAVEASDSAVLHLINLAVTLRDLEKFDEAKVLYERAYEKAGEDEYAEVIVELDLALGNYDDAETRLRALREMHGADQVWRARRLAALARLGGRLAEAERHLDDAISAEEEQGLTESCLRYSVDQGWMDLLFKGDTAAALRRVEAALARWPVANRPYGRLVGFYAWAGQTEQARAYLAKWEERADSVGGDFRRPLHSLLGYIALGEGRPQDAITEYGAADRLQEDPDRAEPDLAFAYDQAGEPDSALAVYERYVTMPSPRNWVQDSWSLAPAYERLGALYEQQSDTASAIRYYARFVELWKDADPELQPRVEAARRAIEALSPDT